jgi:hypothetical protein
MEVQTGCEFERQGRLFHFTHNPCPWLRGNGFMQVICPAHMSTCVTANEWSSLIRSWFPICKFEIMILLAWWVVLWVK